MGYLIFVHPVFLPVIPFCPALNAEGKAAQKSQKVFFPVCRACTELVASENLPSTLCMHAMSENYHVLTTVPEVEINRTCEHFEEYSRSWDCTLTIPEIRLAIEKGYRILEVYEVWYFKEKSRELFTHYMNDLYCLKTQASGWPEHVRTEDDRIEYLEKIKLQDGISLNPDKIVKKMRCVIH